MLGIPKAIQDSDVNTLLWGYLALLAEEERKKYFETTDYRGTG